MWPYVWRQINSGRHTKGYHTLDTTSVIAWLAKCKTGDTCCNEYQSHVIVLHFCISMWVQKIHIRVHLFFICTRASADRVNGFSDPSWLGQTFFLRLNKRKRNPVFDFYLEIHKHFLTTPWQDQTCRCQSNSYTRIQWLVNNKDQHTINCCRNRRYDFKKRK